MGYKHFMGVHVEVLGGPLDGHEVVMDEEVLNHWCAEFGKMIDGNVHIYRLHPQRQQFEYIGTRKRLKPKSRRQQEFAQ